MIVFLLIFLSISGLMNFYVLRRLFSLFSLKANIWFYVLFVACTFSYLLGAILERWLGNSLTKIIYQLAATWMGVSFLLLCCLVIFEIVNLVFSPAKAIAGWTIVGVVFGLTIYSIINASRFSVVTVGLNAPVEMRIVQLCDIHLGSTSTGYLARIVEMTNSLSPDVVLITGDLLDSHRPLGREAVAPLDNLIAPTFMVAGNHEHYFGIEKAMSLIGSTKVRLLRNEIVEFRGVRLIGIDDNHDKDRLVEQIASLPPAPGRYDILMCHRSHGLEAAAKVGIDLMLAGHTHFGQIYPFNYVVGISHPYIKGLYKYGGCFLYVSGGTGIWGPRMRLGSRNEIVLLELSAGP